MAREYASFRVTMWSDDDFRALPPPAQHLYFVATTAPNLTYAGVIDWRPGRLAALAAGWSAEVLETAAEVLEERLYLVIDRDTEEALVRSFARNDGLMKNPRMAVSLANAYAGISSAGIRGVIVHELLRLQKEAPELHGWKPERVRELLTKTAIDPSTYPCRREPLTPPAKGSVTPPVTPSITPPVRGPVTANPRGTVTQPPTPAPAPAPAPLLHPNASRSAPPGDESEPGSIDAGAVVAAWVEGCEANDVRPSSSQRGQVGKLARELLAAGNDPQRVVDAARAAGAKGFATIDRELTAMAGRRPAAAGLEAPADDELPVYWRPENTVAAMIERGE